MRRFFLAHDAFSTDQVRITEPGLSHRLCNVLRLQRGDPVIFMDNSGWEYETVLQQVEAGLIVAEIQQKRLCPYEPHIKITLYQSVLKGDRFEWVLQKGTEIGVSAFLPILGERCIVVDAQQVSERKLDRWRRIIQSAAEQSRRGRLPPLQPLMLFSTACEQARRSGGLALIPWAGATRPIQQVLKEAGRDQRPFNVSLFIGPEGGFSRAEIQSAQDYGLIPVHMGPRILRAETAGIIAAVLVLYQYGDMEGRPDYENG